MKFCRNIHVPVYNISSTSSPITLIFLCAILFLWHNIEQFMMILSWSCFINCKRLVLQILLYNSFVISAIMHVYRYWQDEIIDISNYYRFLTYLNPDIYTPRKIHPLLQIPIISSRESNRIAIKHKVMSGAYILRGWIFLGVYISGLRYVRNL
jgi:hypothetical protein